MNQHISRLDTNTDDSGQQPNHGMGASLMLLLPDYLANAGGVIDLHQETIDDQPDAVLASVARIGAITRDVLRRAAAAATVFLPQNIWQR